MVIEPEVQAPEVQEEGPLVQHDDITEFAESVNIANANENENEKEEEEKENPLIIKRVKKTNYVTAIVTVTSASLPPRVPSSSKAIPESSSTHPHVTKDRVDEIK
ncbi:hypothetical protein L6452_35930 [Arctium lappa]|uniref:Uncharacterized protein n=1 Tax=Arctium lappa TaxID=4217 RepID=A0ACB8Y7W2_ARCLA|nr:hypothetical protein L6452_35930 [Arctium lappa]